MQGSRHFAFALAVAITLVVAAPGAVPASASASRTVAAVQAHPSREVFGFALASSLADPSIGYPSWNFNLLSTVAFFGLHVNGSGQLVGDAGWNTWNSSALSNLVSVAHQHGTKVVLTVVLQDFSPNTPTMCSGLQHADTTVAQTVTEVRAKGVDGVNIDYEGLDGSCGTADPYWAQHALTAFAAKMRAALGSSYYLSIDTYASSASDGYGFFDVAGLAAYVDSFFVMAYDLEYSNYSRPPASCPTFCLGPTAPLAGYYYNDTAVVSQYLAVVGAGKVILGVPYYGRKACVGAAVPNAFPTSSVVADSYLNASGEATDPAVQPGSFVSHRDANSSGLERWDTWYNTNLHCTRELYWDDAVSLGKKYDLINANRLRGAGIWNLNYGGRAPELWAALAGHFSACTSVVAGGPGLLGERDLHLEHERCSRRDLHLWSLGPRFRQLGDRQLRPRQRRRLHLDAVQADALLRVGHRLGRASVTGGHRDHAHHDRRRRRLCESALRVLGPAAGRKRVAARARLLRKPHLHVGDSRQGARGVSVRGVGARWGKQRSLVHPDGRGGRVRGDADDAVQSVQLRQRDLPGGCGRERRDCDLHRQSDRLSESSL